MNLQNPPVKEKASEQQALSVSLALIVARFVTPVLSKE
jgi:hypothetical protein